MASIFLHHEIMRLAIYFPQVLESRADSVIERGLSSMFRDQKREPS